MDRSRVDPGGLGKLEHGPVVAMRKNFTASMVSGCLNLSSFICRSCYKKRAYQNGFFEREGRLYCKNCSRKILGRIQGGRCMICGDLKAKAVDHCHANHKVRGLLCGNCNSGLGFFRDNTRLLKRARLYLRGNLAVPKVHLIEYSNEE